MVIDKQIEEIKLWANQNEILIIEGELQDENLSIVNIELDSFKEVTKKIQTKIIVCYILNLDKTTFKLFESNVEEIDKERINELFKGLLPYENKLLGFSLYIFTDGIAYRFASYVEETSNFIQVQKAVNRHIEKVQGNEGEMNFRELPQEKANQLGKQLAENENYPKLKSRSHREQLGLELFNDDFKELRVHPNYGISIVVSVAENYYETTIKPIKEKELKEKIKHLKSKNYTKVQICSELSISKDTLNKYY